MISGAPLEDARHLYRRYEKLRDEAVQTVRRSFLFLQDFVHHNLWKNPDSAFLAPLKYSQDVSYPSSQSQLVTRRLFACVLPLDPLSSSASLLFLPIDSAVNYQASKPSLLLAILSDHSSHAFELCGKPCFRAVWQLLVRNNPITTPWQPNRSRQQYIKNLFKEPIRSKQHF